MNCACYRFSLSMQSTQSQVSLPILFNDTARTLLIKLVDNGKPYYINDGCRAVFYAQKADGKTLVNDCVIEKNAKIRYDFTAQTASAEGISKCEIRLYGSNGRLITSPKFIMVVDSRVVYDDQIIASYDEFTTLDAIIATEHSRAEAETGRVEAETARAARFEEVLAEAEASGKLFTAIYGSATCAEISSALAHNKIIVCRWGSSYYLLTAFTPNGAYFGGVNSSGDKIVLVCELGTNDWSHSIIKDTSLPEITAEDNGKFLRVVDGVWTTVELTDVSQEGV